MEKPLYEELDLSVIEFESDDVIVTSTPDPEMPIG